MIYDSDQLEESAIIETASKMCVAARTAPKAKGVDNIVCLVLTGDSKGKLADKIKELAETEADAGSKAWFLRDAENVRSADSVVLIGEKHVYAGLKYCSYCGFESCQENEKHGGKCALGLINLGIAVSSAVSVASCHKVDNRVMLSIGKAAEKMNYTEETVTWLGIPLNVAGKNIFFDRK